MADRKLPSAAPVVHNEHIAWCRYTYDESGVIETIETCDSDAKGAFKVYAAAATAAPQVDLEKVMAEPKSDTEPICVNCGREIVMSEYGPPINDICWSHTHNGVVWCNWPTAAAPVEPIELTEEESQLIIGAIPLQALPDNKQK